ncbi:MAG: 3-methyl-2-oxobutanoate hydroxymethyltransferase [Acidobacteriota bacterium]|nr:3-methyl-2-oxobutanoate hydroxymethyltransferase [Acidobacteriota bacterium]
MPSQPTPNSARKMTTHVWQTKKVHGEPITMLTGYDYPTAVALDRAGIDGILVGDSLGMVVLGYDNTLPVTMQDMIHHCSAVARGAKHALLVGDLPFMSYQASVAEATRNAGRLIQKGGMDAVKLEGGRERAPAVKMIVDAGIPVMGHIGLTPQSVHQLGGWKVQGKSAGAARHLIEDALILEDAGCFSIVIEAVPAELAALISQRLTIPAIGIGAGIGCDGQLLVVHDVLGFFDRFTPHFVKKYGDVFSHMREAFGEYIDDVKAHRFPAPEHAHTMDPQEYSALVREIEMLEAELGTEVNLPERLQ